jgi:TetR/AcrR family transcriptional repressor of nem operon
VAWDKQHKANTREKIIDSAAKLFLHKGFDAVSIDDVMSAAGLTRGAFYAHFKSKNALYSEAIVTAGTQSSETLYRRAQGDNVLEDVFRCYLHSSHCEGEQVSCPLAFMLTDITQRDPLVRNTYTKIFEKFVEKIETQASKQSLEITRESALQSAALMIGGLAVARAVNDDELSTDILQACKSALTTKPQRS